MKLTMSGDQLTFSTVRDWREPQIVAASGLMELLAEAARAGFKARVLETCKKPFGYRVTFCKLSQSPASGWTYDEVPDWIKTRSITIVTK